MNKSFWNRKIPGFLGLFFVIISLAITVYLVIQGVRFLTQASPSEIPQNVKVTNISDNSFSVTYTTSGKVSGSVNLGQNVDSEETVLDDRDQLSNTLGQYYSHSISTKNLGSSQEYKYSILSGTEKILNGENLFDFKTAEDIDETPPSQKPIVGKVIKDDGSPAEDTLVYFSTEGAQELSTLTKEDGSYIMPLNSLRDVSLSSYFELNENSLIKLLITDGKSVSNITLTIGQIDPVPTIILSSNYDFRESQEPLPSEANSLPSQTFPEVGSTEGAGNDLQINTPEQNQGFTDSQPEFSGSASPNIEVEIEIHSDENIKTKISTDSQGAWEFRPDKDLSAGEHTITIRSKDSSGIVKTITRRFTVYAQGTQVTESATPSATIAPSPTPTKAATPTPTPIVISSDPASISAVPQPTIPPTGGQDAVTRGILGVTLVLFGAIVFIITRYKIPL